MPVTNVQFYIPPNLAEGIATGSLKLYGTVVRDVTTGQIVKHLKPATVEDGANKAQELAKQMVGVARTNKKVAIAAGAAAGVLVLGGGVYAAVKGHKNRKIKKERDAKLQHFNDALSAYIGELNEGELHVETLDALQDAMAGLESPDGKTVVEIGGDQFATIVDSVRDYTDRFAKANDFKTDSKIISFFKRKPSDMESLKGCLDTQRQILELGAA